ncbi:MAG: DNA translocase FtsK [Oscillospiraceae bacterium]|nr:DNA translocase FtsK [Oscillospiraceae bacterium]
MRTVCLSVFVLCVGCVTHLALDPQGMPQGAALLPELFAGGNDGTTGGVICGGVAMLVRWMCGPVIPYIIFIIAGIMTLLAGMLITIPSIFRALQNRPRADWEDEETNRPDPAQLVVDHIAKKRIEHKERKRKEKEERQLTFEDVPETEKPSAKKQQENARGIMQQIEGDIDKPVAAAGTSSSAQTVTEPNPETKATPVETVISVTPVATAVPETVTVPPVTTEVATDLPPVQTVVPDVKKETVTAQDAEEAAQEVALEIAEAECEEKKEYIYPPIDLLQLPKNSNLITADQMRENIARLDETLLSFKIGARVNDVTIGPSITRYEVELERGVKLNKLTGIAKDIALSFGVDKVRIETIPGKIAVVGIEVPNSTVTTVTLREVIGSEEFINAKSKSSFVVGKDIGGNCIVGNIAKLPHMLIAGTTGSGKSVCMNSLIISLLYKASPEEVKMIMIDPKMVELGNYNGIPHLMIPVVTDPKKAAGSLQWAVTEMMRRYKAMSDAGVRDLESYNAMIADQLLEGQPLPQLVVIIDELADLMLVAAKEVEESIIRIAQMGRASGIHLVIATQRPSADVITGVMKANIPSRIAFSVSSAMESRIILDTNGAESLVGKGDMLYAPIGSGKPHRVQGCFVTDKEVELVSDFVKNNSVPDYDEAVLSEIEKKAAQKESSGKESADDLEPSSDELMGDEMLSAAVDVVLEIGQASVSMLQRRLKLGYSRAARIVDEMEELGIVGPYAGSKPRQILVTKEQWEKIKNGQPSQMEFDDLGANDADDPGTSDSDE